MHTSGVTIGGLANELRTSPSTVSRWLNGSVPRGRMLEDLAKALEVSVRWLRDGEGNSNPDTVVLAEATRSPEGIYSRLSDKELQTANLDCAKRLANEENNVVMLSLVETASRILNELQTRLERGFRKAVNYRDK